MDKRLRRNLFIRSNCKGAWLHRFIIVNQWYEGVQERCMLCGLKVFFPTINGKSNNTEYIAYHARQCLPPQHRLFNHEFRYDPTLEYSN